jgi:hypothetical protein
MEAPAFSSQAEMQRGTVAVFIEALEQSLPTPEREEEIWRMIREKEEQIEVLKSLLPPENSTRKEWLATFAITSGT